MVASKAVNDNGITGSWHNSGYFGHFRSKVRNDFMNEYRQRAKPNPPAKYVERSSVPVRKHVFSKHDSRERYKDNALYFVDGNGRRQVHAATFNYKPDFIAWMPHRQELIENRQPMTSMYKSTFSRGTRNFGEDPHLQKYSTRIAEQATKIRQRFDLDDEKAAYTDGYKSDPRTHYMTSYRNVHCTTDPRAEEARVINTISTQAANSQRMERARSARPSLQRETVASCLSWAPRPKTTVPNSDGSASIHRIGSRGLEATPLVPPQAAPQAQQTAALPQVTKSMEGPLC